MFASTLSLKLRQLARCHGKYEYPTFEAENANSIPHYSAGSCLPCEVGSIQYRDLAGSQEVPYHVLHRRGQNLAPESDIISAVGIIKVRR